MKSRRRGIASMSAIATVVMSGLLEGCQTAGEPVQIGEARYRMTFLGADDAVLPHAETLCREKGFARADVISSFGGVVEFRCLRESEGLGASRSSAVECLPGLMVVDPTLCPNH